MLYVGSRIPTELGDSAVNHRSSPSALACPASDPAPVLLRYDRETRCRQAGGRCFRTGALKWREPHPHPIAPLGDMMRDTGENQASEAGHMADIESGISPSQFRGLSPKFGQCRVSHWASASGSLGAASRFRIMPSASTTQIVVSLSDTSKPA